MQPENTYSYILKVTRYSLVRPQKAKTGKASTLITATTTVHLLKSVSSDLTIKSDFVLTNPVQKDGVQIWSM